MTTRRISEFWEYTLGSHCSQGREERALEVINHICFLQHLSFPTPKSAHFANAFLLGYKYVQHPHILKWKYNNSNKKTSLNPPPPFSFISFLLKFLEYICLFWHLLCVLPS